MCINSRPKVKRNDAPRTATWERAVVLVSSAKPASSIWESLTNPVLFLLRCIEHDPMHPCPHWRIWIITDQSKTFCAVGNRCQYQGWRDIHTIARILLRYHPSCFEGRAFDCHDWKSCYQSNTMLKYQSCIKSSNTTIASDIRGF